MIDHYIISRFNLKRNTNAKLPDKKWMDKYLKLFRHYCYRSLVKQTNQNFKWIIMFDDKTTDKDIVKKFPRIKPVFIKNYPVNEKDLTPIQQVANIIKNESKSEYIITSRIDVDDSYHKTYIEVVQKKSKSIINGKDPRDLILNFKHGYIRDIRTKKISYINWGKFPNPFISLLEKNDKDIILTCSHDRHSQMSKYFEFHNVQTLHPMWIQNIHGDNLSNAMQGIIMPRVEEFGIK